MNEVNEVEKEFKSLISEEQYKKIIESVDFEKAVEQINFYYLDGGKILERNKINVRVRKIKDEFFLQIKNHMDNKENGLVISKEYEEPIDFLPEAIEGEKIRKILKLEIGDAYLMGSLKTLRLVYNWSANSVICLDKNFYFGTIDYEIEVEIKSHNIEPELRDFFLKNGVDFNKRSKGKRSRFFKAHKTMF
ncbi:MAG: CYTH domain-containing protein [Oscillospiraceae bacterium]|jgi:uncharacterized protein YjbK|nr:CYTH domain-containing protein [Oscillospiraceae bacterium]